MPACQHIALDLKRVEPRHCGWGMEKGRLPVLMKISKVVLRLGALTRVTSEPNLKINGAVSKTAVRELVGSLAMSYYKPVNIGRY